MPQTQSLTIERTYSSSISVSAGITKSYVEMNCGFKAGETYTIKRDFTLLTPAYTFNALFVAPVREKHTFYRDGVVVGSASRVTALHHKLVVY